MIVDFHVYCVYWSLVKARKIVWESQVIDSSSITQSEALWIWRCDVTTSNSIQDGGALVVNILVFDLRVQLQHCTYQRNTLLFALIKVSTFIYKREISGLSSPFNLFSKQWYFPLTCHQSSKCYPSLGSIEFRNVSSNGATVICVRLQSSKSVVHIWCFKFTVHSFEHSRNNVSLNCSFLLIVIKCHYRFMKKIQKKWIFNQCL